MLFGQSTTVVTTTNVNEGWALAGFGMYMLFVFVLWILMIVAYWKVFEKADEAGWKSIVPFYNTYTLFRIAGRNGWLFLALFVPIVNLIVLIMVSLDLAKHFGKSQVFGIFGLFLFSFIGYLMLGFGDAKYVGTKHE